MVLPLAVSGFIARETFWVHQKQQLLNRSDYGAQPGGRQPFLARHRLD
jgi:hypothetical protein